MGLPPSTGGKWPLLEKFRGPKKVFQFAVVETLYNDHLGDCRKSGGHCREVETRVRVWTVRQKMAVVERSTAISGSLTELFRASRERNLASRMTHVCSV